MIDLYFYFKKLAENGERGQTMAEYAVVLAVITAAVVAAISALGGSITSALNAVGGRL
jgi:Flp pilus assembly pilin Flp